MLVGVVGQHPARQQEVAVTQRHRVAVDLGGRGVQPPSGVRVVLACCRHGANQRDTVVPQPIAGLDIARGRNLECPCVLAEGVQDRHELGCCEPVAVGDQLLQQAHGRRAEPLDQ